MADCGEKQKHWVIARTKERWQRKEKERQIAEHKARWAGSDSLSDGCIAHRNQVIQRKLNVIEVKKMMSVGRRLGIQLQGNEEEVQSRMLEMEFREDKKVRN
ncbi:hypothetical protein SLE2022_143930 [Rubroshorea leprosula]